MKKNKSVKLAASLVVLGILCGVYFGVQSYVKRQEEETSEEEEETTEEAFSVDTDKIQSLKFLVDKNEVTFVKEDDTWYKDDEREFPVDQDVLSNAASSISQVDADRVLEDVENLNEYDLDSPQNTITVKTEDGEETVVRVGMKNDSTSQYYISLNDEKNKVYVVSASSVEPYLKSLYDYAEAGEFPAIDSSSITKISVDKDDISYQFVKDPDTELWYVDEGGDREKADTSKVSTLTGSVGSLSYGDLVDYHCTDDAKYGFDKPYAVMKIEYQEEETVEDDEEDISDTAEIEEENASDNISSGVSDTADGNADTDEDEQEDSVDDSDLTDSDSVSDLPDADSSDTGITEDAEDSTVSDDEDAESADTDTIENTDDGTVSDDEDVESVDTDTIKNTNDGTVSEDEDTESEQEPETILVNKELILTIGSLVGDDRYVRVDDSKEIYTLAAGTVAGLVDKELSDYWDLTVNYLSVNQLESLDVERAGEKHTVNVSRETSESEGEDDEESTTTTTLKYSLDGTDFESTSGFMTFYNKFINLTAQSRLTETYSPEGDPDMSVISKDLNNDVTELDFYEYDVNFYAAVLNDEKVYLINKMTYRELADAYENFLNSFEEDSSETDG